MQRKTHRGMRRTSASFSVGDHGCSAPALLPSRGPVVSKRQPRSQPFFNFCGEETRLLALPGRRPNRQDAAGGTEEGLGLPLGLRRPGDSAPLGGFWRGVKTMMPLQVPQQKRAMSQRRGGSGRRNELKQQGENETNVVKKRTGKIFSLFSIVNFNNNGCQSTSSLPQGQSNLRNGTCYTSTECQNRGGSANGGCAAGFGVCCVFIVNTATTITQNCTYIQNPSFPNTDTAATAALTYTVARCSNDICTLRLDFETFTTRGTSGTGGTDLTDGMCTDTFVVTTNTNQNIPTICGENLGQHIYVDIGSTSGNTATLAFTFSDTTTPRTWDIKVSQIECSNANRPPNTCLQYQTGLTGRIETFNFANANANANENHLNSQNYAVCIRAQAGFCCVQYQVCADQSSTTSPQPGYSLDPNLTPPRTDDMCQTVDYVGIDSSAGVCISQTSTVTTGTSSKYCGQFLSSTQSNVNEVICDCTQPFSVDIFTNAIPDQGTATANTALSHGLCLEYMQIPC